MRPEIDTYQSDMHSNEFNGDLTTQSMQGRVENHEREEMEMTEVNNEEERIERK